MKLISNSYQRYLIKKEEAPNREYQIKRKILMNFFKKFFLGISSAQKKNKKKKKKKNKKIID